MTKFDQWAHRILVVGMCIIAWAYVLGTVLAIYNELSDNEDLMKLTARIEKLETNKS